MHFFARHRENIRQSSMSSRLLWPCLLLAALLLFQWQTIKAELQRRFHL